MQRPLYTVTWGISMPYSAASLPSSIISVTISQQQLQRILHHLFELPNPLTTHSTIYHLMVKAACNSYLIIPLQLGTFFGLNWDSNLFDCTDRKNTCLWGIDDGGKAVDGCVHAHIADGEGSTLIFFWLEFAVTSALSEILDLCGDGFETESFD